MNPKDKIGSKKLPMHVLPAPALAEVALAALDGAEKYGAYNWRDDGIVASNYYNAAMRHMMAWWEGEQDAKDSDIHHIAHAAASLIILLDAIKFGNITDDRPPGSERGWLDEMSGHAAGIIERHEGDES